MLILTRRSRQALMVGTDVQVTVLEVKAGRVRLGITAPREVKVLRKELVHTVAKAAPEAQNAGLVQARLPESLDPSFVRREARE